MKNINNPGKLVPAQLCTILVFLGLMAIQARAQDYQAKGFKVSIAPIVADAAGRGYDDHSVGPGGLVGFGYVFGDLGFNVGYRYSNIDPLTLHVVFANAEIFFLSAERLQIYGSTGSGYYLGRGDRIIPQQISNGSGQSLSGFGFNMGVGVLYYLKENLALFVEPSYRVVSFKKLEENGISVDLNETFEGDVIDIAIGARYSFR